MAKKKHAGGNVVDPTEHGESDAPKLKRESKAKKERLEEIQSTVRRGLERAIDHYKENLEPEQKEATDYYYGRPFGDEEEGRSQVVSTDVRDAVLGQMPGLMDIFFGPERVVEFAPRRPTDVAVAEQMTDAVNYVVTVDNPGYTVFLSLFKDALVRKLGIVKWWQDESYRVEAADYTGLTDDGLLTLYAAEETDRLEITGVEETPEGPRYSARVTRTQKHGCQKIAAIPPEEFVFTPDARDLGSAPMVAHVREVTAEYLRQLGIKESLIEKAQSAEKVVDNDLDDARQHHGGDAWSRGEEEGIDPTQRPVLLAEAYTLIDGDGDDIAELRKFWCVGEEYEIANGDGLGEIVDELPFAVFTPEPEPHTIVGLSNHDLLKDVQRVKSQVLRETLNSLALAVDPVTEVVEHQVNMTDVLSREANKIVRTRAPGMMREVAHQFVGRDTLPVLEHYDNIKQERTGRTKASEGLDADSLQSSTKAAVNATLTAAQQRLKYVARVFAETGMKQLFRGLVRLMVKHQNGPRMMRLRDSWVEVDPRHWDATMDVIVSAGIGQGTTDEKIQLLAGVLQKQVEFKSMGAPFIKWFHIRNTFAKAAELGGWRNPDLFLGPWSEQQEAEMEAAMAQNPAPPDPNMMLVQVEAGKAQAHNQIEQQKLVLEERKIMLQDDREREKIARDAALKELELELKHAVEIEDVRLSAKVAADRAAMDAEVKREQAANEPTSEAA